MLTQWDMLDTTRTTVVSESMTADGTIRSTVLFNGTRYKVTYKPGSRWEVSRA
jgi:hypothetical protein